MKKIELNFNFDCIAILLTVVFIVLKVNDLVSWSWWWVLSPIWILLIIMLGCWIAICVMRKHFHWTVKIK